MARSGTWLTGGKYVYVASIINLFFTGPTKAIRIGKATLSSRAFMLRSLRSSISWKDLRADFREAHLTDATYVYIPFQGRPDSRQDDMRRYCRQAVWILAASEMFRSKRTSTSTFGLRGETALNTAIDCIVGQRPGACVGSWSKTGTLIPWNLDNLWASATRALHTNKLFSFFSSSGPTQHWSNTVWRAAMLMGRSYLSTSRSEALLYQVFALETLLLLPGDLKSATLEKRLNGILGWTDAHAGAKALEVYKVRCDIVHNGDYSSLKPRHQMWADELAKNVLYNIFLHPQLWTSKQRFVEYCSLRGAKRVWTKNIRLRALHGVYSDSDFKFLVD